ncbi:hypothetical protein [Kutzneria sp. NPDC052558]|uniref:hypothetical protein n=1 Tax=Kutzneria sp. NPDC052558 TaxID=3364121 RepID=UPI0037CC8152
MGLPGGDESRWQTRSPRHTVVFAGRTTTSTIRLLETLWFFGSDDRVRLRFTVNETSRFSVGAREVLGAAGVRRLIPWPQLRRTRYGLLVSASENLDFHELHSDQRVLVLPHGIGFNKIVPSADGPRLAGLPPVAALRTGRVKVVLAHPDQHRQLVAACPEIDGHTVVTGDPTFDRLRASRRLAEHYRHDLGAGDRRVVFLSSTWGEGSQLGRARNLATRLLGTLPADRYQVVMAVHPNVWVEHDIDVHRWLRHAVKAGLVLLPPERGWHAALVAADLVIGDHGSISLYAAALDKPLLLTGYGDEVVPGTPVDRLGRLARRLDHDVDLRKQVDAAVAEHDPGRLAPITGQVFAHVGDATTRLRDELYRELDLAPREGLELPRVPDARPDIEPVTAFNVLAEFTEPDMLTIDRFPQAAAPRAADQHLAVREDESDLRIAESASVLIRAEVMDDPAAWAARNLAVHGALVVAAATPTGCHAMIRDGRRVEVAGALDPMLLASAVYACVLAGRPLAGELVVAGHRVCLAELGP